MAMAIPLDQLWLMLSKLAVAADMVTVMVDTVDTVDMVVATKSFRFRYQTVVAMVVTDTDTETETVGLGIKNRPLNHSINFIWTEINLIDLLKLWTKRC